MIKRNFIYPQLAQKSIFILTQRISKILKIQILSLSPGLDQKKHEDADPIEIPQPENKDTLKSSESTESNSIETSSPKSVDIFKFPKSFFTFFQGAGNLPSRTSQAYDVDKFTELEGCISDTPPLKPEILHNEILDPGRKPCCDRPPPSVN